jgi:hypothetical protein
MSQSTSDPDPPNQHHISFKWERTTRSRSGANWVAWLSIFLAILGILLTIALAKGWL